MKHIIFALLLIVLSVSCNAQNGPTYFSKYMFHDGVTPNTILYVCSTANGTNEYKTITDALAHYVTGAVILLAPEYFNEDITISADNVYIQGLNKELSKIKSLTVTGGYCRLENFTVNGTATFTSQKANSGHWNPDVGSKIENIIFRGALNFGTVATTLIENVISKNCGVYGGGQITVNLPTSNAMIIYGMEIRPTSTDVNLRSSLYVRGGSVTFEKGNALYFDSVAYVNTGNYTLISFSHCNPLRIYEMAFVTSTAFHILVFDYCRLDWGGYQVAGTWTINGAFELDIINSTPSLYKNIVFNSTANSRIMNMQQRGYLSTSQISGTGLNKLRIYNSSLSGTAPVGLADDRGNNWSAFMDN